MADALSRNVPKMPETLEVIVSHCLAHARRRDIDVVVVWPLDRWGRSMANLVVTLQELRELRSRW